MPETPVTPEGLEQFDHLEPAEAVRRAWVEAGRYPYYHFVMQEEVRQKMPVLGRALDRFASSEKL